MAKKLKLPKRIAGVKIPKPVRKGPVGTFLNSSAGQMLIAEAILVAAGAIAVRGSDPHSRTGEAIRHPLQKVKRASRAAMHKGARAKGAVADGSERLADALRDGVAAFKASLENGRVEPRAGELDAEGVAAFKASLELRRAREFDTDSATDNVIESETDRATAGKKKPSRLNRDRQTPR
jgi:hypothetical protein